MKLIDIHAHLEHKRFEKDLNDVIERCRKKNCIVIASGVNSATNRLALELSKKHPDVVKCSFGLYPLDALAKEMDSDESGNASHSDDNSNGFPRDIEKLDVDEELNWVLLHKNDCVAIGEIGLDYNWKEFQSEKQKQEQKENFRKILNVAKKIDKPVVIHSRKAEEDAIEILEEMGMKKVVMHCFNGKKSLIKRCVENGWYFSVPPVITRLLHFSMLVEIVPLEQLLTETDSPYLSPVVGERNEPINVEITLEKIAEIKKITKKEVAEQIYKNASSIFNL